MRTAQERREELKSVYRECTSCTRCPQLAATRSTVVFGAGDADAELMFVGEAPGRNEDLQGRPFVGQAGRLLDELLAGIGLARADVFIANVLKCRPPGNRDPLPQEVGNCQDWLHRQIALVQPRVVCTLGNFSTKLLRGEPTGITRLHGQAELCAIGSRVVRLYPLYHPAAALYTPAMLEVLRTDFGRIPELLALPAPEQPSQPEPEWPAEADPAPAAGPAPARVADADAAREAPPEPDAAGGAGPADRDGPADGDGPANNDGPADGDDPSLPGDRAADPPAEPAWAALHEPEPAQLGLF